MPGKKEERQLSIIEQENLATSGNYRKWEKYKR
jgi:hypothetical protein